MHAGHSGRDLRGCCRSLASLVGRLLMLCCALQSLSEPVIVLYNVAAAVYGCGFLRNHGAVSEPPKALSLTSLCLLLCHCTHLDHRVGDQPMINPQLFMAIIHGINEDLKVVRIPCAAPLSLVPVADACRW